jgi:hypothetical protein
LPATQSACMLTRFTNTDEHKSELVSTVPLIRSSSFAAARTQRTRPGAACEGISWARPRCSGLPPRRI